MSEHDEQVALFEWADFMATQIPELTMLFAIPNGGHRHKAVAKKMRDEGVKAGVPDVFLAVPSKEWHGLFIEMKHGKNKTTDNQDQWIVALRQNGYKVEVCYGWQGAAGIIKSYLGIN